MAGAAPNEPKMDFKELEKFSMFPPSPGLENIRARLVWSCPFGNPRATVFTGHRNEKDQPIVLQAPMDPETFELAMMFLEEAIRGEPGVRYQVKNRTREKSSEEGKLGPIIPKSDTYVGKDKDGFIWISIKEEGKPEVVFRYVVSMFHDLFRGNTQITEADASVLQARATVRALPAVMRTLMAVTKDPNAVRPQRGGKPNNSNNRSGPKKEYGDLDDINF